MNPSPSVEDAPPKLAAVTRSARLLPIALGVLMIGFAPTLYALVRFSLRTELFSHIVLIPFVSAYLIWIKRGSLGHENCPNRRLGLILMGVGAATLAWYVVNMGSGLTVLEQDQLCLKALAFVLLLIGVIVTCLGWSTVRKIAFPLTFLIFMVPLPVAWVELIESFLQHRSASAAAVLFRTYGTPFFREETYFQLPGINLQVAPECSGIRSSLALFITSIVAGYLFLRSPAKRAILALAVIPLAIVRNGFRVFVIGELCVHVSPAMIDSYIHHNGGPIFFALSLVPFFFLLWVLIKVERRGRNAVVAETPK